MLYLRFFAQLPQHPHFAPLTSGSRSVSGPSTFFMQTCKHWFSTRKAQSLS
jgi:hypothetical protein